MPSTSDRQRRFFGAVLSYKLGKIRGKSFSKKVKKAAKSMTLRQIKDFLKVKEIIKKVNESSINDKKSLKIQEIIKRIVESEQYVIAKKQESGKNETLESLLSKNKGYLFDEDELFIFQSKQSEIAGFGKSTFVLDKSKTELSTQFSSNNTSHTVVFKKLKDTPTSEKNINQPNENPNAGLFRYACFIELRTIDSDNDRVETLYFLSDIFDNLKDKTKKTSILQSFITRIGNGNYAL